MMSHLLRRNININRQAEKLEICWKNLTLNYPHSCHKDYLINALYMQVIRNAPFSAEQLFDRYFSFCQNDLSQTKIEQKNDIVLCVSLNQENFAHIVFVSQNVHELGYHIEELKDSSAARLMPLFFARKHSKFLLKEITENNFYAHLAKEISVFVREKSGYIRPATLYLSLFPYVKKGFYCLARIRLQETFDDYLLMLPNGKIEGGTQEISKKLNLDYNHSGNIEISDICHFGLLESRKTTSEGTSKEIRPPSPNEMKSFSELLEHPTTTGDADFLRRNISSALKPSKFQTHGQREISAAVIEEDDDDSRGLKVEFFPFRDHHCQEGIQPQMIYLTHVSNFTYDEQTLYIIKLTDVTRNSKNPTFQSPKKAFNFETSFVEEEIETIPHETDRDLDRIPKIDFPPQIESPHSLVSQDRLLSRESCKKKIKRNSSRNHDNLRMERRKIVENFQTFSERTPTTRMSARASFVLMNVERAIHQNKKPVSYRLVKISVIGFILLSIGLYAYYQIEGNKKFDLLVENTNILEYSLTILYYVNECTRSVTPLKLIDLGYIPKNRNGAGLFDWNLMMNFHYIVPNLTQANNKLRNSMYYFNEEQRTKFYELIPVVPMDSLAFNPKHNAFDIHTQLVSSALKLYLNLPKIPSNTDPDLNFIFNNTINDLLTHDREIFTLLQEEDKRIVDEMSNFVLILLGIVLGTGVIVIFVLIRNEVNFIKKKMHFFDHFLRINERDICSVISKSTRFYQALKQVNFNEEDILYEVQCQDNDKKKILHSEEEKKNEKPQQFIIKKKKANFKSINKDSWIGVLTLIGFILWFWIAYSIFYNEFLVQSKITQEFKSQIIETSLFLSKFSQGLLYLYIYLGGLGNIKVLETPITTAWEENYKELIEFNGFFTGLMDNDYNVKYDETIKSLANGDICALVVKTPFCYNDGKGAKLQGIIGISNYAINSMINLKRKYDLSDKSEASMKAIYSDTSYAELERIYYSTMMPTYRKLQDVLKEVFLLAVSDFKNIIFTLNKVWLVTFLVMGVVYWKFGLRRMEREKIYFRAILRTIPVQIILSDKFLEHYMMKDSSQNFYF